MYHIVICDDDEMFVQYMKKLILNCRIPEEEITISVYYTGEDLIREIAAADQVSVIRFLLQSPAVYT